MLDVNLMEKEFLVGGLVLFSQIDFETGVSNLFAREDIRFHSITNHLRAVRNRDGPDNSSTLSIIYDTRLSIRTRVTAPVTLSALCLTINPNLINVHNHRNIQYNNNNNNRSIITSRIIMAARDTALPPL